MNKHQKHLPLTWACAAAAATVRHLERVRFQLLLVSILSWQCIPDIYGQTFTNLQLSGHSDAVNSVAFSPDGKTLLTGSADHTARLWNASTGQATRILSQHTEAVNAAVFSHSGNSILTGSSDGKLGFWSGTGDFKTTVDFGLGIYSVAISPDGTRFMVGTGTLLLVLPPRPSVYVYDAQQGGQPLLVLGPESLDAFYTSVAYSPTEAKILTGMAGVLSGEAKLWDAKSGNELFELGILDRVNSVAFSPDGAKVLTASGNAAHLWDVATGMAIRDLTGHTAEVKSAAFSPDGKKVLTGSSDKTARLWDAATGELLRTFTGHSDTVNAVAFSPDGTQILTGSSDKTALLWATPSLSSQGPTVQTLAATAVTTTSAQLNGSLDPNGLPTTAYFQYGTTTSYGSTTPTGNFGTSAQTIGFNVTDLAANTPYHYRIVASNSSGTSNGDDATFTTGGAPTILMQPVTQHAAGGASVTFSVGADGQPPLSYQWRFNGQSIPNATHASLTLNAVTAADSGGYSVLVWNSISSVVSATASLAVLTEGANGTQPSQQVCPSAPSPSSQDSLVVVTHGFLLSLTGPPPMPAWVTTLANYIQADAPSWSVTALDWRDAAWGINPELALTTGGIVGSLYGQQLAQKQWQRVHLIGHSAGSAVIQAIADQLRSSPSPPVIQMTLLDPYLGMFLEESGVYGQNANWADCYFTQDWTGGFTSGNLSHAYNVDVDWADPNRWLVDYGSSQVAFSTHEYSQDFYIKSVTNIDPQWCGKDYGFRLSAEGGGEANQASHLVGNGGNPTVLCGPPGTIPTPNKPLTVIGVSLENAAHAVSQFGATLLGDTGAWLSSVSSNIHPKDGGGGTATNGPAWLAVALTITNAVNFVQFDAGFTDTNSAEGLLTVYLNTNQIGMVDERVAPPSLSTYRFALPATLTNGLYTLSFRLDVFTNAESSITLTNVATGFAGITQPISLEMLLMGSNNTPVLKLTAAPGYNYLVQSSTNLVDWVPSALLVNTNGAVLYADPAMTNSNARYYRALLP